MLPKLFFCISNSEFSIQIKKLYYELWRRLNSTMTHDKARGFVVTFTGARIFAQFTCTRLAPIAM